MGQGIVIAGTHSGCGKTTITLGVLAALKKTGLIVQSFKAGPDFIDAGLHRLITGRPSRNLDLWMCGGDYVKSCFDRHSQDVDISVVEGVMGLYDGDFSTARLADALNLPVILIVDAYGMAESAGAVVEGFASYKYQSIKVSKGQRKKNSDTLTLCNSGANIAGVIFNRVASEKHYERLKSSVHDVEVFGYLPRDLNFEIPNRHLGLIVAEENPIAEENIERLTDAVLKYVDVEKIKGLGVRDLGLVTAKKENTNPQLLIPNPNVVKIAIAYDRAFCFYYEDNLDLLKNAGAEIVTFSPLYDSNIPDNVDALYIGGGYPELYAGQLSKNQSMLEAIYNWADSGKPMYAECGGLMYLSKGIHNFEGNFFQMAGILPFETRMIKGRYHLGYREIELKENCILGKEGDRLRGHEFHYSGIINSAEEQKSRREDFRASELIMAYSLKNNMGERLPDEGYRYKNTLASYIHIHFVSNPAIAGNFINFIKENQWNA